MNRSIFLLLLFVFPLSLSADTTLYACIKDGKTTLTNIASHDCDSVKTYKYPSYKHDKDKAPMGLRPSEMRELEAINPAPINQQAA
jgi:hypothetical protein